MPKDWQVSLRVVRYGIFSLAKKNLDCESVLGTRRDALTIGFQ